MNQDRLTKAFLKVYDDDKKKIEACVKDILAKADKVTQLNSLKVDLTSLPNDAMETLVCRLVYDMP